MGDIRARREFPRTDPSTDPVPIAPASISDGPSLRRFRADLVQIIGLHLPQAAEYGRAPVGLWPVFGCPLQNASWPP